jgi:hypothetical protein
MEIKLMASKDNFIFFDSISAYGAVDQVVYVELQADALNGKGRAVEIEKSCVARLRCSAPAAKALAARLYKLAKHIEDNSQKTPQSDIPPSTAKPN